MDMKELECCFESAIKDGAKFIGVEVETRGSKANEIIINPRENFRDKLEYYKKAYNDDLTLKSYDGIRIVNCEYGDDYIDLGFDLGLCGLRI